MGVKYLTAYAESLGEPVVRDLPRIPPFASVDDGTTTNVVVLDASGGLGRYLRPDESERSLYDYQEMFERVAVDVAALRALGYDVVPFLDAAVPAGKLPVWKTRRRADFKCLGRIAQALESPDAPPPPLPKNSWVPPECATQHLGDAYAACGCEVHFGIEDVDLEAAAFARRTNAHAVLTCDSDFYVTSGVRVWHYEHFDLEHALWAGVAAAAGGGGGGIGGGGSSGWLPPEGSPGVRGPTQSQQQQEQERGARWPWWRRLGFWGRGKRQAAHDKDDGDDETPPPLPVVSVREIRTDLLRRRLRLSLAQMPLLAACLGSDTGVAHISRRQMEAVFAEYPPPASSLLPLPAPDGGDETAAGTAALAAAPVPRWMAPSSSSSSAPAPPPPPPASSLPAIGSPEGPGGTTPFLIVEILAHELARQLDEGILSLGGGSDDEAVADEQGGGGGGGGSNTNNTNNRNGGGGGPPRLSPALAAACAAASARAAASCPSAPATARFVAHRATAHARAVRRAYDPSSAAITAGPDRPAGSFRGGGVAPSAARAVLAHAGMAVRGPRADDVREPAAPLVLRELRMRVYAGCGLTSVKELIYTPIAARPLPPLPPSAAAEAAQAAAAAQALPPSSGAEGGADASLGRTAGFFWQEDFVDVDIVAELAALGRERAGAGGDSNGDGAPLSPLLPESPEIVAARQSGEALVSFACAELLRLELVTPVEAELLQRQASPQERARVRRRARARLLDAAAGRWSGNGGAIACMRSVRVAALLMAVHSQVAALLDNHAPTIESVLDARVFNELWRREVARLEAEPQPKGAAQRARWVREEAPPQLARLVPGGGDDVVKLWYWLPEHGVGGGGGDGGGNEASGNGRSNGNGDAKGGKKKGRGDGAGAVTAAGAAAGAGALVCAVLCFLLHVVPS